MERRTPNRRSLSARCSFCERRCSAVSIVRSIFLEEVVPSCQLLFVGGVPSRDFLWARRLAESDRLEGALESGLAEGDGGLACSFQACDTLAVSNITATMAIYAFRRGGGRVSPTAER